MAGQREQERPASRDESPRWLDGDEQEAWRTIAAMFLALPGVFDAQLQRDAGMTMFEYFVLSDLSMTEHRTLRMSDLAIVATGSPSRLSNVMKRLEQRGWVRREPDPCDGRATNAILTDAGFAQVERAAAGHVETVRRHIIDPLTAGQVRTLNTIGQKILRETPFGRDCRNAGADRVF